jgi:DNA-binding transcriptional LysR family regulator
MDTARLRSFIAAAEAGSLSQAAARMRLPLSTISRHVAELERELGATLLERTGRGVRVSTSGERYLTRARAALRELALGLDEVRDADATPHLRLSAAPDVSTHVLPGVLTALIVRHPALRIDCRADVRRVSLVEEPYDAAIRIGPLEPSDLLATRLGAVTPCLCGPPAWRGRPLADIDELIGVAGVKRRLGMRVRGEAVVFQPRVLVSTASFGEAAELAVRLGRAIMVPSFVAAPHIASGALVRLAPEAEVPQIDVSLVRPASLRGSPVLAELARLLTDALAAAERIVAS